MVEHLLSGRPRVAQAQLSIAAPLPQPFMSGQANGPETARGRMAPLFNVAHLNEGVQ
jgi:hypothetical protein